MVPLSVGRDNMRGQDSFLLAGRQLEELRPPPPAPGACRFKANSAFWGGVLTNAQHILPCQEAVQMLSPLSAHFQQGGERREPLWSLLILLFPSPVSL